MKDNKILEIVDHIRKIIKLNGFTSLGLFVFIFGFYMIEKDVALWSTICLLLGRNIGFIESFYKK